MTSAGVLRASLLEILDTAIESAGADFGNIQAVDAETGDLEIVAQRGFSDEWVTFWNEHARSKGACGSAIESGARVIVENVTKSAIFRDAEALEVQLRAGVWACQSTPLYSSNGEVIGVFNTHYRHNGQPKNLPLLDSLAKRAALVLERNS